MTDRHPLALVVLTVLVFAACTRTPLPGSPAADGTSAPGEAVEAPPNDGIEPPPRELDLELANLGTKPADGTGWQDDGAHPFTEMATIRLGRPWKAKTMELSLDANDAYRLEFRTGVTAVGVVEVGPKEAVDGLATYTAELPLDITETGADTIVVTAKTGDGALSIGHLVLTE